MEPQEFKDVQLHLKDRVAEIVINRPDKLNAIRIQTYRELITALKTADQGTDYHVLLLRGEGAHFTAGNDLADLVGDTPRELMECVQELFETVAQLMKVVVAAVEGVAVGIGTTILLHCDIAIASKTTRFRLPFVNLGVCPEGASSVLLSQYIGQRAAREVLLTGRFFTAEEAFDWGLVNALSEPGKAYGDCLQQIELLLKQPLDSLVATKKLLRAGFPPVSEVVASELQIFSRLLESAESQERIKSYIR